MRNNILQYQGTVRDVEKTEQDMRPLLWEGFAQVTHNTRRNGHIKLNGHVPAFVVRQYEIVRPVDPGEILQVVGGTKLGLVIVFEYNRPINRARIRISERDAERLWPML
jgi:hypothetical protein